MNAEFLWSDFLSTFRDAANAAGFAEHALCETPAGPLSGWTRAGNTERRIYLSAGIHGDEPAGPLALLELMRSSYFSQAIHWIICPAINPTGLATGTRENADGIDLNRDYLKRQTTEVQAHASWLEQQPSPDIFLSLHEDWETTGFYLYEINQCQDQPQHARHILNAVEPWFSPEPEPIIDGHRVREPGWIHHAAEPDLPDGWPEAIFLAKQKCQLSFTFETPSQADIRKRIAAHCAAVKAAVAER